MFGVLMLLFIQVGDGLEIYIVCASNRPAADLEAISGIKQLQGTFIGQEEGEKIYVVRRELKKD